VPITWAMVVALAVAVLALIWSAVPATAAERPPLVDEVLELCGLREKIEQLPGLVYGQLRSQPAPPDGASRDAVGRALQEAFQRDRLYGAFADGVARRFDATRGTTVAAVLRTDLLRRMARLEVEASRPEMLATMMTFAARIMISDRPAPARVDLVHRLDTATGSTALTLAIDMAARQGVTRVLDVVLPPGQRRNPPATFDRTLKGLSLDANASARTATEVALLFTYRAVADDELRRYVEFTESEHGQWLTRLVHEGIVDAIEAAASEAVELTRRALAAEQRI
jgi:hypothetical protein